MALPRTTLAHLALVAGVALLAYSGSFGVPLQYDDPRFLLDPASASVSAFLASPHAPSRIVGTFTFALGRSIHGSSLAGFHAVNLAIHLAAAACVYFLAALACRTASPSEAPGPLHLRAGAPIAGLVAALLFVSHPIQTEAVTYLVQRFSSLAALFYAGAVLAYAHAVLATSARRRRLLFSTSGLLGVLALLTKENAVTLPFALAVYDLAVLPGTPRQRLLRLSPFFAVLAAGGLAFLDAGRGILIAGAEYRTELPEPGVPVWLAHLFTQPRAVLKYVQLLAWPAGQSIDHYQPLYSRIASLGVLGPSALLALLLGAPAALAWRARSRSPLARVVLLGLGWFVVSLSVECVIPLADSIAEHRVYLPSIGLFLAAGAAVVHIGAGLSSRMRTALAMCVAVAVVALGAATWARNRVWRDHWTLWNDARDKAPLKARPYVCLAQDLIERGEPRAALELLERARSLPVVPPLVDLNMGAAYQQLGDLPRAEAIFRDALGRGFGRWGAHRGLAQVLIETGRIAEGCEHVAAALQFEPLDPLMRDHDASCRFSRGDSAGAASGWARLAAEMPRDPRILFNLALAQAALGDIPAARDAFSRFLGVAGPEMSAERERAGTWLSEHGGGR